MIDSSNESYLEGGKNKGGERYVFLRGSGHSDLTANEFLVFLWSAQKTMDFCLCVDKIMERSHVFFHASLSESDPV